MTAESAAAEFVRIAKQTVGIIERATKPDWWNDVEALSYQLDDARRKLGHPPGLINGDFNEAPAFFIAKTSREYLGTSKTLSFRAHEPIESFQWCWSLTTMIWSNPFEEAWHHRQHLDAIIDEGSYSDACRSRNRTVSSGGPEFLEPELDGIACRRIAPNHFRAIGNEVKQVAIECLKRWIDAVELLPVDPSRNPDAMTPVDEAPEKQVSPRPLYRDLNGKLVTRDGNENITVDLGIDSAAIETMDGTLSVPKSLADAEFILWHKGQLPDFRPTAAQQMLSALLHAKASQQSSVDETLVSADQLGAFARIGGKVIRQALRKADCKPWIQSTGKGNPHQWRYCDAVRALRNVKSGKLRSFVWPNSSAKIILQDDSSKIPARNTSR
jgi:hypothetical protein